MQRSAFFGPLTEADRRAVARHSAVITVSAGEVVFHQGDRASTMFVIARGEVIIRQQDDESRYSEIAQFIAGESFGEIDVLRGGLRSAGAVAATDLRLIAFPAPPRAFGEVLRHEPTVFARVLHTFTTVLAGRIRATTQLMSQNSAWIDALRRQVYRDKLTGLNNHAFLTDAFKSFPSEGTGAVLVFKPDHFKDVNDTWGHQVGDRAIQLLAQLFRETVTPLGDGVRFRGNELVALLPDPNDVPTVVSRLRSGLTEIDLRPMTGGTPVPLTASIGIASTDFDGGSGQALLDLAYQRMMTARNSGGDRVAGPAGEGP